MAIDKSLRQHYQDGEKVKKLKLVEMGEELTGRDKLVAKDKKSLRDPDQRSLMDRFAEWYLGKKIPGGIKTVKQFKNLLTGKQSISETLKSSLAPEGFKASPTNAFRAFNLARKTGVPVGKILSSPLLPIVGITGIAALANKYRKQITGYDTQREYEEARDIRVLEKRQTDMLNRMKRGDNYSEKNLIQVTNELAKKRGDVDADDMAFIKEIAEDPSFTGEGYDDTGIIKAPIIQDPDTGDASTAERIAAEQREIEQRNRLAEQREQDRLQREVTRQAEENAARIAAEQAAAAPPPQFAQPQDGGGGRDYGHQETRSSSGWERSPFKKGGRIDKALEGRSRDI